MGILRTLVILSLAARFGEISNKKTIVWLSPKISVLNRAGSSAPAFDNGAASNAAATPERTCPQSVRLSEGMQSDKFTLVGEKKEKRLKKPYLVSRARQLLFT